MWYLALTRIMWFNYLHKTSIAWVSYKLVWYYVWLTCDILLYVNVNVYLILRMVLTKMSLFSWINDFYAQKVYLVHVVFTNPYSLYFYNYVGSGYWRASRKFSRTTWNIHMLFVSPQDWGRRHYFGLLLPMSKRIHSYILRRHCKSYMGHIVIQ